ncbi:MAG: DNA-binding LytR/AlgR family response regulator [Myxococcota bacterium]|jgi:DNA-binding LytR/AlgR family response regulator
MTLRVLVADDEAMARKRLIRLAGAMPGVEIVGECVDGNQVLERVQTGDIDLILLDIDMPGLTGVETLALLGDNGPAVLFTTAHADHAIAAFDGGAVDYVLKPVEAGRLARGIERARRRIRPASTPNRVAVPTPTGLRLLDPTDLIAAVIDGESVVLHIGSERWFTAWRLAEIERRLPADGPFFRVHRRALLNLDRVERLVDLPTGGYVAHVQGGLQIEVSRQAARILRRQWKL